LMPKALVTALLSTVRPSMDMAYALMRLHLMVSLVAADKLFLIRFCTVLCSL